MTQDIREMINNIKNVKHIFCLNENQEDLNILYHGSKYLFNKFDMNKINTGQHSQDFGHGLYFTSNKETAIFYANELSNTKTPIEKYKDIIKNNENNQILYQYLKDNRIIAARRILDDLISKNVGDVNEWKNLLHALNTVERYGYLYTVKINNGNFINKDEYFKIKYKLNLDNKQMNNVLLKQGYNGIKYKIKSFGLNPNNPEREYNVVIIDDSIITIINVEKINFEGTLKLNLSHD